MLGPIIAVSGIGIWNWAAIHTLNIGCPGPSAITRMPTYPLGRCLVPRENRAEFPALREYACFNALALFHAMLLLSTPGLCTGSFFSSRWDATRSKVCYCTFDTIIKNNIFAKKEKNPKSIV